MGPSRAGCGGLAWFPSACTSTLFVMLSRSSVRISAKLPSPKRRRVLGISVDQTIATDAAQIAGDSRFHLMSVGRSTEEYHVVVYSPRKLPVARVAANVWVYTTGSRNKAAYFKDAAQLGARLCHEHDIEVLYTQDLYATGLVGWWLKRKLGIPLCACIAGDMIGNKQWQREAKLNRVWDRVGRFLLPRCDAIRVLSTTEEQKLRRLGIPDHRIWKVNNLVNFDRFTNAREGGLREQLLDGGAYDKIVLFLGRLVPQKDIDTLLRAMTRVVKVRPRTLLVIAGDGPLRAKIERRVKESALDRNVRFVGAVPPADTPRYYVAADVFVLSSLYEGFARVLMEAAAACTPVVVTEVSGTRDIIRDAETGYIVRQRDDATFAECVLRLLADPIAARAMGERARAQMVAAYNPETLLLTYSALFDTLAR